MKRLNCKEASRLLSADMDGTLGFGRRIALRLHLIACDACVRVKAQMAFLRRAMADYPPAYAESERNGGKANPDRP